MSDTPIIDFDEPNLAGAVERLPPETIDALPFGAIRIDREGRVAFYSKAEAALSGYGDRPALGRAFFTEIAPCMDNEAFRGRIDQALAAGKLDLEFGFTGDFADPDRSLRVRIQSASEGGYWIFLLREG